MCGHLDKIYSNLLAITLLELSNVEWSKHSVWFSSGQFHVERGYVAAMLLFGFQLHRNISKAFSQAIQGEYCMYHSLVVKIQCRKPCAFRLHDGRCKDPGRRLSILYLFFLPPVSRWRCFWKGCFTWTMTSQPSRNTSETSSCKSRSAHRREKKEYILWPLPWILKYIYCLWTRLSFKTILHT